MLKTRFVTRATRDPVEFRAALAGWFKEHGRDLPWRRSRVAYEVLVSEMMLQQTQVGTVLAGGYFERFLAVFPTIEKLASANDDALLKAWEGLGYYRRARLLRAAAQVVMDQYGGEFPSGLDALLALPGVGRYTAGALRAFAFDQPAVMVDGNIARVIARLDDLEEPIDSGSGQSAIWAAAEVLACRERPRLHHSALMELGQVVCRPGVPACLACPVSRWCATRTPEKLPVKKGRVSFTSVEEHAVFIRDEVGRVLMHRESGRRRQGLWKLPVRSAEDIQCGSLIERENYTITRYKVALFVYETDGIGIGEGESWIPADEVSALAMPAPYRRVIGRLLGFCDESM